MSLNALAAQIAAINHDNGWFDIQRPFGDDIALIHSEVSEAYEEYRNGRQPGERYYSYGPIQRITSWPVVDLEDGTKGKPEGIPSELADIIVRVLDTAHRYGIDMDAVMAEKLAYNASRGYRHGGKVV